MKKKILITLLLISQCFVFAQERFNLDQMKQNMKIHNPDLLKLQQEYERSVLDVKDAWAGLGPVVDLQFSGTYMLKPPVDSIYLNVDEIINSINWPTGIKPAKAGQTVKIYDGMENTMYSFQLSLTQPIFTWGKITNAIRLYKKISDICELQLLLQQSQMETELETRVISLQYLKRIQELLSEEKVYAQRLVETTENAEKSGMLLHQDVVDARIQAKELEIAEQDVEEQIYNLLLELRRTTGIEELTMDNIEYEVDEALFKSVLEEDKQALEEKALSGHQKSLRILTNVKEANDIAAKISKGNVNWKPDIALQTTGSYGGSRIPFVEPNWLRKDDYSANFSIGIKATLWDGGKKVRDVARKKSEVKTAEINTNDTRATLKKTLNTQVNTAEVCLMKIEYQDLKIETAEEKIKQKETVFQSGYGSETEVLNEKIDRCNQLIEREKQGLSLAAACMTIKLLTED